MSTERENAIEYLENLNRKSYKVRIRTITINNTQTPAMDAALKYFNDVLKVQVKEDFIEKCHYVEDWVIKKGINLLVVFRSYEIKNDVYKKRSSINGGLLDLCDELDNERLAIWKGLSATYEGVFTYNGGVVLLKSGVAYFFVLRHELETFPANKEDLILRSYCNICQAIPCNGHVSLSFKK